MSGVLEHGDIVGAKKVSRFTRYNLGDIIVFKVGNEKVIHKIVGTEIVNGKLHYKTQGVNNEQMDSWIVSRRDILGKVDISKFDLNKLLVQVEQGKITLVEAFGMSLGSTLLTEKELQTAEGKLINKILECFSSLSITTREQLSNILFGDKSMLDEFLDEEISSKKKDWQQNKMVRRIGAISKNEIDTITRDTISNADYRALKDNYRSYVRVYNEYIRLDNKFKQKFAHEVFEYLFDEKFEEEYEPDWLKSLHSPLDGSNKRDLAFEYNGPHHDDPGQQKIDAEKKRLCKAHNFDLIILDYKDDLHKFQDLIYERYKALTGKDAPRKPPLDTKTLELFLKNHILGEFLNKYPWMR